MTEMSQMGGTADRHARWVAMWREAVSASWLAIGLVELSTTRFIELSRPAAALLGTTPERGSGLNYLSVAERPREAEETFRLVREGMLDGLRARRRFRQRDGSMVEVESSGWAIRSPAGPDLGLWVAHKVPSGTDHTGVAEEVVTASHSWHAGSELDRVLLTLDGHWRVARISTHAGLVLGQPPAELIATSIIELTHPSDHAALLFAFARSTTETSAGVPVRLRHHDGSWRTSQAAPTMLEAEQTSSFALLVAVDNTESNASGRSERSGLDGGDLLRIASELRAEGIVPSRSHPPNLSRFPAVSRLTTREWEILVRLLDGERVPSMAADLFVSQSTVRHHLSSIFSKFGVHSQAELIRRLRSG